MSSGWNFLFGFILVILWIISGSYVTRASIYLNSYKNMDEFLARAYSFTWWASFVTWFLVAVFILLIFLSVIGLVALFGSGAGEAGVAVEGAEGAEVAETGTLARARSLREKIPDEGISWFTIGFLIFALALVSTTGVLAAIAATDMTYSSHFNPSISKLKTAYNDCIIAAVISLGAGGILVIGIITYFIVGYTREQRIEAEQRQQEKQNQLELLQLDELRHRSLQERVQQQIIQQVPNQSVTISPYTQSIAPSNSTIQQTPSFNPTIPLSSYASSTVPLSSYRSNTIQPLSQQQLQQILVQKVSDQISNQVSKQLTQYLVK